nr:hypothetical protein Q903MT_gene6338 [Picea sitchensis]
MNRFASPLLCYVDSSPAKRSPYPKGCFPSYPSRNLSNGSHRMSSQPAKPLNRIVIGRTRTSDKEKTRRIQRRDNDKSDGMP